MPTWLNTCSFQQVKSRCLSWFTSVGMLTDRVVVAEEAEEPIMLTDSMIMAKADTLVNWLLMSEEDHGIYINSLFAVDSTLNHCETVDADYYIVLNHWVDSVFYEYASMLRYGAVNPENLENYHFKVEHADAEFNRMVREATRSADDMSLLLRRSVPKSPDYALLAEYRKSLLQQPKHSNEVMRVEVNMERLRWRVVGQTNRHIVANVAEQMVRGYVGDSAFVTSVACVGRPNARTPMLLSQIYEVELNPRWNVPNSIVMNEIAPRLLRGDTTYFRRNGMVISQGGKVLKSSEINWTDVRNSSQQIYISQGSGAGNALGRVKFKFANPFNVYLHDTNSPSAFGRKVRTLSHGCVRVGSPFELALFCVQGNDDYVSLPVEDKNIFADCMRYSIGRKPQTDEGRKYIQQAEKKGQTKKLEKHSIPVSPTVSVLLDYKTYTIDSLQTVQLIPDVYDLDTALYHQLQKVYKVDIR